MGLEAPGRPASALSGQESSDLPSLTLALVLVHVCIRVSWAVPGDRDAIHGRFAVAQGWTRRAEAHPPGRRSGTVPGAWMRLCPDTQSARNLSECSVGRACRYRLVVAMLE